MFDFQKEVVLNDISKVMTNNDGVVIDGMTYKKGNVVDGVVYKTMPVEGKKATIKVELSKVQGGKKQVRIELGLDRDYRGSFGSALYYFRKPILIDFRAEIDMAGLESAAKKIAASNDSVLSVKEVGEDYVLFEAADDYITVRKAVVVPFECDAEYCNGDEIEVAGAEVELEVEKNQASFGTYEYLIHNLRLPTYANLRFASPAAVEMPMQGAEYVQYSFEYVVARRLGGLSVVGQVNHSSTCHTFFVPSGVAAEFEGKLGLKVVEVKKLEEAVEEPEQAGE